MRIEHKVALITGGNSGIGRGIAHRFVREGVRVGLVGRDRAKGNAVLAEIRELGGEGEFFAVDLSDETSVAALVDDMEQRFGRIDVVVNNAGVGSRRCGVGTGDSPGTRWQKLRGPNLDAAYFVCAYTLPVMARAGGGAIVNISSTSTLHGNWGLYCVAKAGVEALTRAFAVEGAGSGVRVNCVSPGWIATGRDDTTPAAGTDDGHWPLPPSLLGRMGTPEEIAGAVLFLAGPDAAFVTGQTLIVDGGLTITDYPSLPLLSKVGFTLRSTGGPPAAE